MVHGHITRREWLEISKRKLDEWDEAMQRLEARAADERPDAEGEAEPELSAAKQRLRDTHEYWSKVRRDTGEVWDSINEEVADAWETNQQALEKSMDEARNALR